MANCNKCNKISIQACDSELCPFELNAKCIKVGTLSCIDTPDGASLYDVLKSIDSMLCNECERFKYSTMYGYGVAKLDGAYDGVDIVNTSGEPFYQSGGYDDIMTYLGFTPTATKKYYYRLRHASINGNTSLTGSVFSLDLPFGDIRSFRDTFYNELNTLLGGQYFVNSHNYNPNTWLFKFPSNTTNFELIIEVGFEGTSGVIWSSSSTVNPSMYSYGFKLDVQNGVMCDSLNQLNPPIVSAACGVVANI